MTDAELADLLRPHVAKILKAGGDARERELRERESREARARTFSDAPEDAPDADPAGFSADDVARVHDYYAADADGHYPGHLHRAFGVGVKAFADAAGMVRKAVMRDGRPAWVWARRPKAEASTAAFAGRPDADTPTEGDPDPHAAVAEAMLELALDAAESGDDPSEGIERLRALLDDPDARAAFLQALDGTRTDDFASGKWNEADHPRSKTGHFIAKDRIAEAKDNPRLAEQLRKEVKPEDAGKLDRAISGETDLGRTKRGEASRAAGERRAAKVSTREAAERVIAKLTREGDLRGAVTADDLHALADHLQSGHMTVADLRRVKDAMRGAVIKAGFGGARAKEGMVAALVAHAKGEALDRRMKELGVTPEDQAEMRKAVGLLPKGQVEPVPSDREPTLSEMETGVRPGGGARAKHLDPNSRPYPATPGEPDTTRPGWNAPASGPGATEPVATPAPTPETPPQVEPSTAPGAEPLPPSAQAGRLAEVRRETEKRLRDASIPLTGNRYAEKSDAELGQAHRNLMTNLAGFRKQLKQSDPNSPEGKQAAEEIAKFEPRFAEADAELKRRMEVARLNRRLEAVGESERSGKLTVTESEMRELLGQAKDAYRDAGLKGKVPYSPEHFKTSDLTGAKMRHYVELPNGQLAHPDELILAQKRGRLQVVPDAEKPGDYATARTADRLANPPAPAKTQQQIADEITARRRAGGPRSGADDASPTADEVAAASRPAPKPDLLADPKALADAVHAAATHLPDFTGEAYRPEGKSWVRHKVFVSKLYDHMKSSGQLPESATLKDFQAALFASHRDRHLNLGRNDLPQVVPPDQRGEITRSEFPHPADDWTAYHIVNAPTHLPPKSGPAATPAPADAPDMAMLDQPAGAVAPGSRTGDAVARKEKQQAKRAGVPKPAGKPKSDAHAAYLSASPLVRDHLDAAFHNAGTTPQKAHAHKDRRDLAAQLASAHAQLHDNPQATPDDRAAMEAAMRATLPGLAKTHEAGDVVPFDGSKHVAPKGGVFTGDKVRVTKPGWVLPGEGGAAGKDYVAAKAEAEAAGGGAKPAATPAPATPASKASPAATAPKAAPPKPAVPAGHAHAGTLEGGAVVAKDPRSQGLTTHFAPGEPERQAKRLGKAIGDAMDYQGFMIEAQRAGGQVQLGNLVAEVKSRAPGATDSDVLAALSHLHKTRGLEAHALNETRSLTTKEGGTVPLYGSKDAATATLWDEGRARQYWMLPPGKTGRDVAAAAEGS